jgi:tetratricopeptide (TPR) repeat protein
MTIDLSTLWDFNKPDVSEERFRSALSTASGDEALILQTQIARTYGLRRDFSKAQQILADIEPQLQNASNEARTRYYIELGRTYSSATHPPESQTDTVKKLARSAYLQAAELAQNSKLDNLAIDALHMMVFVDTAPEEQIEWNRKALALAELSTQPDAKKWEGSLHNNMGYALHLLGRYEDALSEFNLALVAHEKGGNPQNIRVAHWMIAWTLRALGRLQEAIDIQLRLEQECEEAGEPDPYVFEELELLYQAVGEKEKSEFYAARRKAASQT